MKIQEKIEADFKAALKKKDTIVISTLRMLKSAIHNKEIEKKGAELPETDVIKIITKQVQQHQDSIEQFKKGKREDLVEKETKELEVLKSYLPKQLTEEEIANVVKRVVVEAGVQETLEFGKVMKMAMAELAGKAPGKLVSQIVNAHLSRGKKES